MHRYKLKELIRNGSVWASRASSAWLFNLKFRKVLVTAISLGISASFYTESACYGLATLPASQNPVIKREILAALHRTKIRYAESEDAIRLLRANNASCLLLSSGNYLVTKEVARDDTALLRAIIHEDIEAIMQITAKDDKYRYRGIKELILKHFPPGKNNDLPMESYVNHTVASAFEWLVLTEDGVAHNGDIPESESVFIGAIASVIIANKHNLFTDEFWDSGIRGRKIREALRKGMRFYLAASPNNAALLDRRSYGMEVDDVIYDSRIYTALSNCSQVPGSVRDIPLYFKEESEFSRYFDVDTVETGGQTGEDSSGREIYMQYRIKYKLRPCYVEKVNFSVSHLICGIVNNLNPPLLRFPVWDGEYNHSDVVFDLFKKETPPYEDISAEARMWIDRFSAITGERELAFCIARAPEIIRHYKDKISWEVFLSSLAPNLMAERRRNRIGDITAASVDNLCGRLADMGYSDAGFKEDIDRLLGEEFFRDFRNMADIIKLERRSLAHFIEVREVTAESVIGATECGCLNEDMEEARKRYPPIDEKQGCKIYNSVGYRSSGPPSYGPDETVYSYDIVLKQTVAGPMPSSIARRLLAGSNGDGKETMELVRRLNGMDDASFREECLRLGLFNGEGDEARSFRRNTVRVACDILHTTIGRLVAEGCRIVSIDESDRTEEDYEGGYNLPQFVFYNISYDEPAIKTTDSKTRKCLVLDCDGVLWGGVVGEDGADGINLSPAHLEFQRRVKALKERGVILALNSKNNPEDVLGAFAAHPEMPLRPDDFAAIRVNWNDKATNISELAAELNIGSDSMVFLDDTPHERALVRKMRPEVLVPDIPVFPDAYPSFIKSLDVFGKDRPVTPEDMRRTEMYAAMQSRNALRSASASMEEYYRSLDMKVVIREGQENLPFVSRIVQLIERTNQFNLTGRKRTEEMVHSNVTTAVLAERVYTMELSDRFGNAGIVGVMILTRPFDKGYRIDRWYVDTFCMSCRAIGLTAEETFMAEVANRLRSEGTKYLEGKYVYTGKNGLVKDAYGRLGFREVGTDREGGVHWEASLNDAVLSPPAHIEIYDSANRMFEPLPELVYSGGIESVASYLFTLARNNGLDDTRLRESFARARQAIKEPDTLRNLLWLEINLLGFHTKVINIPGEYKTAHATCGNIRKVTDRLVASGYNILHVEETGRERTGSDLGEVDISYKVYYCLPGKAAIVREAVPVYDFINDEKWIDRFRDLLDQNRYQLGRSYYSLVTIILPSFQTGHANDTDEEWSRYIREHLFRTPPDMLGRTGAAAPDDLNTKNAAEEISWVTFLLSDLIYAQLNEDRIYEIRYDTSRLTPSQADTIETYIELLKRRASRPDNIRSRPFSSAQGSEESLIAVYCSGEDFKGEGHVDVSIPEGGIDKYLLKITDMINIALASASIPDDLSREDVDIYRPILSYISDRHKAILEEALAIPEDPGDILKAIRRIVLKLPVSMRADPDRIEEYNRLTREALTAA
ncbi:MAG: HAD-IIIC family phosphatase [Candidatus Omnitrophota bacterium]